ncbi:4373_t:CDS:2 [Dentiscutata erythropus]|uniref:4373_t:CDS:1 n=1 Tax=Dentiscutata erythropus TaxID=1348616 RepID=A0A9N8W6T2_9GLOM|nr:4373_t:CDS:2 [Dentiscutata erythropus]
MGFWEFVSKIVITTTAGIILGPAAIPVGAAVWGTSEIIKQNSENKDVRGVFGFISDCGRETFTGEALGLAAQGAVTVVELSVELSKTNSSSTAEQQRKQLENTSYWTTRIEAINAIKHSIHLDNGQ